MRDAMLAVAPLLAAVAQAASTLLYLVGCFGIFVYLVLGGYALWAGLWAVLGPLLVILAASLLRFPFVLAGLLIAALAGRHREYLAAVSAWNDR